MDLGQRTRSGRKGWSKVFEYLWMFEPGWLDGFIDWMLATRLIDL
jgi:hypothetical protein